MDCVISSGIFLRANGQFACWDDAGTNHTLGGWRPALNAARDIYHGPAYERLRSRLAAGQMPHPHVCRECMALNPTQPYDETGRRRVRYFQVEPSFACQIKCPNCYPGLVRKDVLERTEAGHLNLKLSSFARILADFQVEGISVDLFEFQGHGEPLINKDVWKMIRLARETYPLCFIRVVTNGNFDYRPEMVEAGISEMIFSIDGVDQSTYGEYRQGGDFEQAYRFMKDFSSEARRLDAKIHTAWKYILFDHCSEPAHLERACDLAEAAQLNEFIFLLTQMGPSSRRFFSAMLRMRELAETDDAALGLLESMQRQTSAIRVSDDFRRLLGETPFPNCEDRGRLRFGVVCYMTILEALDANLDGALAAIELQDFDRVGQSLVSLATKLWRLYEARYDMLTDTHAELLRKAAGMIDLAPRSLQMAFYLKAECFIERLGEVVPPQGRLVPFPHNHLQPGEAGGWQATGEDPSFILFPSGLALPGGDVLLSIDAETTGGGLERPRMYFDCGEGFDEATSVLLSEGGFGPLHVRVQAPPAARRWRLDPGDGIGAFRLGEIAYRRLPAPSVAAGRTPRAV